MGFLLLYYVHVQPAFRPLNVLFPFSGLPPTPVQLLHPVSRLSSIKSLQHLCRFCIRQLVRVDHIQELPLPTSGSTYRERTAPS